MNTLQVINAVVVAVGIPSLITACIYVGRKFSSVEGLEGFIKEELKPELTSFRKHSADTRVRLSVLETKMDGLAKTNSPLSLTPDGKRVLRESGLQNYIDANKDMLVSATTNGGTEVNHYDIQQSTAIFFDSYEFPTEVEEKLKDYAFNNGISLDSLLRVGAIYLRDIAIEAVGK